MPLSGQTLRIGSKGDEVKLLQTYLQQLGFGGTTPPAEINSALFDKGTSQTVSNFQAKNNLNQTGEVDPETAKAINTLIEQLQPQPAPNPTPKPEPELEPQDQFVVKGMLRQVDGAPDQVQCVVWYFRSTPKAIQWRGGGKRRTHLPGKVYTANVTELNA